MRAPQGACRPKSVVHAIFGEGLVLANVAAHSFLDGQKGWSKPKWPLLIATYCTVNAKCGLETLNNVVHLLKGTALGDDCVQ